MTYLTGGEIVRAKKAITALLEDNNKSQAWLAEKLGYAHQSGISRLLERGNLTMDNLLRICESVEYEVTIQPKRRAGSRPQGQLVIDEMSEGSASK